MQPSDFDIGVLLGVLLGEGHFGGDGRQPQVTLRMHSSSAASAAASTIRTTTADGATIIGWRAVSFLRSRLVPILDERLTAELDAKAYGPYQAMKATYRLDRA